MLDLGFDLSRSLKVKANGAICKSMYDFLFHFNSNHDAKCHRLEDTAPLKTSDLMVTYVTGKYVKSWNNDVTCFLSLQDQSLLGYIEIQAKF